MATLHAIPLAKITGVAEKCKFTYLKGFGQDVDFGYFCWLIREHGRNVLVDAGATADQAINAWGRPPSTVRHVQTLEEGLAAHGLGLADIDTVILTHLHMDHIAYLHELPAARKIVQQREWDFASRPQPIDKYYDHRFLEGLEFSFVEGDLALSDEIGVLFTPGHTPGGQSVWVKTRRGTGVITGFCCIHENFGQCGCGSNRAEVSIPGIHQNSMEAYESLMKVLDHADFVVANHDARYINETEVA